MTATTTYFDEFLGNIRPTDPQRKVMKKAHRDLQDAIAAEPAFKDRVLGTFIQGSHRRHTAIKATAGYQCDVDIVVVTNFPRSSKSALDAHEFFRDFLKRRYPDRFKPQSRSWCITINDEVTLDLVPTAEPDSIAIKEAMAGGQRRLRDWSPEDLFEDPKLREHTFTEALLKEASAESDWEREKPLWIPDRDLKQWEQTHPLHLITWTTKKSGKTNGYFVGVVQALKWWKRHRQPVPKHPKGYPLEHIVAECCPDRITSVAQGVVETLEQLVLRYEFDAARGQAPSLPARGVSPPVNVMHRIEGSDFAAFYSNARSAARAARAAFDNTDTKESARLWRELFGDEFPSPPSGGGGGREGGGGSGPPFVPPRGPAEPRGQRFA